MRTKKESKYIFIALFLSLIFVSLFFFIVRAGSLTPSSPVGSTMHSLQEVYDALAGDVVSFTGSGIDDLTVGGNFSFGTNLNYRVQIDAEGTPDTFTWSDDGGSTWDATGVAITGAAQTLNNGITITFVATTGHTLGERWDFTMQTSDVNGNIVQQLKYIANNIGGSSTTTLQIAYDNSTSPATITDSSATAILTIQQTGAGNIIDLRDGSGSVFSIDNAGNITTSGTTFDFAGAGEISSGGSEDLVLNAGSGEIKAATSSTFYNENGYAIAPSGEEILRASMPIFGYDFPARYSNSSTAIKISRDITLDANSFPSIPATGVNRRYKFKIQYANNVINANTSSWEIYTSAGPTLFATLNPIANTNIANLDESILYYSEMITTLPGVGVKWYLQVTAPTGTIIQIYQIELLAYDVLQ